MRRIFALILAAVVTVAVVGGILALAGKLPFLSDPAHIGGPTEPTATVIDHIGKEKKVAIVDGGDPNSPIWAEAANADIRTPVVRPGAITPSWTALDELLGSNAAYTQCVDSSIQTKWATDIPTFKASEAGTNNAPSLETRYIQVVNSTKDQFSDEQVHRLISDSGVKDAGKLKIVRIKEVVNTRGFKDAEGCQEFLDRRPQVRINLGVPVYKDGKATGELLEDRGVYVDCHNPNWVPKAVIPTPTSPGTPSTSPTCTEQECGPPSGCKPGECPTPTTPTNPGCKPNECPESKNENGGAGRQGNVPTQAQGVAPPVQGTPQAPPPNPPPAYQEPTQQPPATTPRTSVPPPPPEPEPTEPFDPCKEDPGHPACG